LSIEFGNKGETEERQEGGDDDHNSNLIIIRTTVSFLINANLTRLN
jgi:hypothetical protein